MATNNNSHGNELPAKEEDVKREPTQLWKSIDLCQGCNSHKWAHVFEDNTFYLTCGCDSGKYLQDYTFSMVKEWFKWADITEGDI